MDIQNKICALGFFVEKQYSFRKIKYSEMCTLRTHCADIEKEIYKSNKENELGKEKLEVVAQADDLIDSLYFEATPKQSKIIISVTRDLAELDKLLKEESDG